MCELNFLNGQFLILATEKKQKHVFLICCFLYSTCNLSEILKVGNVTQLFMNQHYKTNPTCYKQDLNYLNLPPSEIMYCRPATIAMGHGTSPTERSAFLILPFLIFESEWPNFLWKISSFSNTSQS